MLVYLIFHIFFFWNVYWIYTLSFIILPKNQIFKSGDITPVNFAEIFSLIFTF